jgi:hypothetical protein
MFIFEMNKIPTFAKKNDYGRRKDNKLFGYIPSCFSDDAQTHP